MTEKSLITQEKISPFGRNDITRTSATKYWTSAYESPCLYMLGRNSSAEVKPYHAEDYDKGKGRDAHAELYAGGLKDEFHTMTACRDFKCSKDVVSP